MATATARRPRKTWAQDPTPATGLAGGAVATSGKLNLTGFSRIKGAIFQDVALASLEIQYRAVPGGAVIYTQPIGVDGSQPVFTYSWDEPVRAPYVEIVATNGGGASATFRAFNQAIP